MTSIFKLDDRTLGIVMDVSSLNIGDNDFL